MAKLSNLNILVVDDSRHMRRLYRDVLEAFGMPVRAEAEDGESGLLAVQTYNPDIIITDMNMHPMDGVEFTRQLRIRPGIPNKFVPILMITGHTEAKYVQSAIDAGISEFLTKPFTPTGLFQRIKCIVEQPRPFVMGGEAFFGPDRRRSRRGGQNLGRRGADANPDAKDTYL